MTNNIPRFCTRRDDEFHVCNCGCAEYEKEIKEQEEEIESLNSQLDNARRNLRICKAEDNLPVFEVKTGEVLDCYCAEISLFRQSGMTIGPPSYHELAHCYHSLLGKYKEAEDKVGQLEQVINDVQETVKWRHCHKSWHNNYKKHIGKVIDIIATYREKTK